MEVYFFDRGIETFIQGLQKPAIAKVLRTIALLEELGPSLGMPHSKNIGSALFELRIRGNQEIRLMYAFHRQRAVILHGFIKKAQKTSIHDLRLAGSRKTALDKT